MPHRTATLEQELYALLGLVVEAASHRTLGPELNRSILGPLGLRDILLPDSAPDATAWDSWRSRRPPAPLLGNAGGIPGFLSIVLSTPDGRRQLGLMINALLARPPSMRRSSKGPGRGDANFALAQLRRQRTRTPWPPRSN